MDVGAAFVANSETPELVQPADCPLHDPAGDTQAAAVLSVPLGNHRFDTPLTKLFPVRIGTVSAVGQEIIGSLDRMAHPSGNRRNAVLRALSVSSIPICSQSALKRADPGACRPVREPKSWGEVCCIAGPTTLLGVP